MDEIHRARVEDNNSVIILKIPINTYYNRGSMTNMHKAFWHSEDNSIKLSMPIAKVDKEKRMVSGFATLDNVDKQDDIVPTDVSVKAFERFRGNLREMHMPIAVGRVVSFKSDKCAMMRISIWL